VEKREVGPGIKTEKYVNTALYVCVCVCVCVSM